MCTQAVQLSTRERQFGKTSECAYKMSNSPHGKGNSVGLPNMHTRGATLNTGWAIWQDIRMCTEDVQLSISYRQLGKTSECTHRRSNSQHGIGSWARLRNVHTRCPTLNMGYAIWQDFRMCTKEVQLNKGLTFGKTSECAYKRSNSQHGIGNLAKHPNVHTRAPTLTTG
ncbi:hypothetical protein PoB_002415500 [Plakobranchus ocellatus]|uniref:Uncharacterized protein n=1 Tax=Plakobranchus ocellatus TaxID=259542 RepID=A0AAV3ZR84_9GAST|nr:hypothetical protein PoB_002415500 [Plakobranchus ocellatus]